MPDPSSKTEESRLFRERIESSDVDLDGLSLYDLVQIYFYLVDHQDNNYLTTDEDA